MERSEHPGWQSKYQLKGDIYREHSRCIKTQCCDVWWWNGTCGSTSLFYCEMEDIYNQKSFDFTFTWWVDWSSSGDDWSATLNSVAGVGLLRRIYQQTHKQGDAINTWIIYLANTVLLIMLSVKLHQSDGKWWQITLVKPVVRPYELH